MPDPSILGFSTPWYPDGVKYSTEYNLDKALGTNFHFTLFIASKFEAFNTRGMSDINGSHDLKI